MKTASFNVTFTVTSSLQPTYLNVSTTGTPLAGITPGLPTLITDVDDRAVGQVGSGGDAIITGRVSANDTVRLRAKGLALGANNIDVIITVFD